MLTQVRLKELLHYDRDTGVFTWKINNGDKPMIGKIAGTISTGYRTIRIDKKQYYAHRLAWFYEYNAMPSEQIDHINQNKLDNRIENLREVSDGENKKNSPLQSNNTSGYVGVFWNSQKNKWNSTIKVNRKNIHLGFFINKEDAIKARKEAEIKYNFHENHGKREVA